RLQVIGNLVTEDLQGPLHPGAGRDRGPGRAAQVRVVEVRQPVGGGPDLAAHPPFLPGHHRVVRTEPGEQRPDRVAVPAHYADHPHDVPATAAQSAGGQHDDVAAVPEDVADVLA